MPEVRPNIGVEISTLFRENEMRGQILIIATLLCLMVWVTVFKLFWPW